MQTTELLFYTLPCAAVGGCKFFFMPPRRRQPGIVD